MRLPIDALEPQLPDILQGLLLWSGDSKNKFKLKVGGSHTCHVNILLICICYSLPWDMPGNMTAHAPALHHSLRITHALH